MAKTDRFNSPRPTLTRLTIMCHNDELSWLFTYRFKDFLSYFNCTWNSPLWSVKRGRCVSRSASLMKLGSPLEMLSLSKLALVSWNDRFSPKYSLFRSVTTTLRFTCIPSEGLFHKSEIPRAYKLFRKKGLISSFSPSQ